MNIRVSRFLNINLIFIVFVTASGMGQRSGYAAPRVINYSIEGMVMGVGFSLIQGATITAIRQEMLYLPIILRADEQMSLVIPALNGAEGGNSMVGLQQAEILQSRVVQASSVYTISTDVNGNFLLSSLPSGTYRVTATKSGYSFTPSSLLVTLPPNAAAQNFFGRVIPGEMVNIPAGNFQMGCDNTNNGGSSCWSNNELPLHPVYLDAYRIDKYEVTNLQYGECVAAGVCTVPKYYYSSTQASYYLNPAFANYPVIWVSWYNAKTYCSYVDKRLPSEAEWEKAARGASDTRPFPWGNQAATCSLADFNFWNGTSNVLCIGDTSAVGSYASGASPYGVMDMAGNVWEWVNDWYQGNYYSISPDSNPPGPTSGVSKVARGGGWSSVYDYLRVAFRYYDLPGNAYNSLGFRCGATLTPLE